MSYETIRIERDEGLVILTLDRPEVRNAIDLQMVNDIRHALSEVMTDPTAKVVIFTGGEKAFAAGADIAELKERGLSDALRRINADLFRFIEELPLPTVAAIQGWALGGGCELAMACDIRVAGEGAKLGQPEVGLGILPGAGAIQRLPRLVGMGRAKELIFTGEIISAERAEQIGLVNRVVPDDQVLEAAKALARKIEHQGKLAVSISKAALNAAAGTSTPYDILEMLGQAVLFESEDKHQRMAAFLEKRAARRAEKAKKEQS